ncbi:hypothetical protein B0A50_01725 [Salinomyces thailandicus]|uniref:Uncharacterized protein n=1 Tax=Salinomyces thailandicus TaxID=706561 RepID=A0A4U0U8Y5_9PEZI|nr:hypothetical protein B0A50_01725 [Salinomyces thailandica]
MATPDLSTTMSESATLDHIRTHDRLSLPLPLRLPLALALSSTAGFVLGTYHGSSETGLRFRAENAHRFPTTQTGWYLYHKSKNYHMALGGISEGIRMGLRQAAWVGLFVVMEEGLDRGRAGAVRAWRGAGGETEVAGNRDFVSTVFAGVGTAGVFSAWQRFPAPTAVRVARMGAKVGLVFGLVQDALGALRGRRLGYVEFIKKHVVGVKEGGDKTGTLGAAVG